MRGDGAVRPLRVVHVVCSEGFAGVERYVTNVAPALAGRGVDVAVVGGPEAAMRRELAPAGVPHEAARSTLDAVRRLLRRGRVDLVHAHMTAAELAAALAGVVTRSPVVATRHFAARRGRSPGGRVAAVAIERVLRREIAISSFVAGATGRPSVVLPNAVPRRPAVAPTGRTVVMAQRLEAEKDGDVGIRAWAASGLGRQGWRLVVAGEGSRDGALRALADDLDVADSVDFVGRQEGLDALLDRSAALLATARAEPFGLSVVEAMAAGVPVVASAAGAHLETVGACSTEWLFPPGDVAACAELLLSLTADEVVRTEYGRALQDVQRRRFDLDDHVDRLLSIYEGALAYRR